MPWLIVAAVFAALMVLAWSRKHCNAKRGSSAKLTSTRKKDYGWQCRTSANDSVVSAARVASSVVAAASLPIQSALSVAGAWLGGAVAIQLYHCDCEQARLWFKVMLGCIIASHLAQVGFSAYWTHHRGPYRKLSRLTAFARLIILAPQAPFFPAIYALHNYSGPGDAKPEATDFGRAATRLDNVTGGTRAARDTLRACTRELWVQAHFAARTRAYSDWTFMLNIDALLGALPQTSVALMAYGALSQRADGCGAPLGLLVSCAAVGLGAVLSKLPGVLSTYDVRLQVFRVSCVAHDIASLAYTALTIATMGRLADASWHVLGMPVTALGALWVIKTAVTSTMFVVGLGFSFASETITDRAAATAITALSTPALVLCNEAMRLSIFGWLLLSKSPTTAAYKIVVDFIAAGPTPRLDAQGVPAPGTRLAAVFARAEMAPSDSSWTFFSPEVDGKLTAMMVPMQAISFCFPFVHAAEHFREQSGMQILLLGFMGLTLLPVAMLGPFAARRYWATRLLAARSLESTWDISSAVGLVRDHMRLTDTRVLLRAVSSEVVPTEVTQAVIAQYLRPDDIDTDEWSAAQFDCIRQEAVEER